MSRRAREQSSGEIYHLIQRGLNRNSIFYDKEDKLFFLTLLKEQNEESLQSLHPSPCPPDFLLEHGGVRVQKSVFEFNINENEMKEIKKGMKKFIIQKTDSIRYYRLCKDCAGKVQVDGLEILVPEEKKYVII